MIKKMTPSNILIHLPISAMQRENLLDVAENEHINPQPYNVQTVRYNGMLSPRQDVFIKLSTQYLKICADEEAELF